MNNEDAWQESRKVECSLWGESLSPDLLRGIPDIQFRTANEANEIAKSGRYRGKVRPFGTCRLSTPDSVTENKVEWMADFVAAHKEKFEAAGATRIVFWIYWYGSQGNMELSVVELEKLALLEIPLAMDYIFVEEDQ